MSQVSDFLDQPRFYQRSEALSERAHALIPGGAHTYSKGEDQFPRQAPGFIARGAGARVWDVDGNEFIDWGMGLRAVILGHGFPAVTEAARKQLDIGANFTRPNPIELELAEELTELIPSAQMVKFAKNGSDVTTAAVKLARAFTGRDLILRCQEQPFFSIDDWFIGDTPVNSGIPEATQALTKRFAYNNLESLRQAFDAHRGQVACVILEPVATEAPGEGFLQCVKDLCREHGAVLIFDEMICGFRWHLRGAQAYFGVTPDLSTFGKALGNGFSVSALVGRKDIMELGGLRHEKPRVFLLSTTHGGETHGLAAALATVRTFKQEPVVEHLWNIGGMLQDGFNALAKEKSLGARMAIKGFPCSPYPLFLDDKGAVSMELRTFFLQEVIRQGVLIPYIAPSYSHTLLDVEITLGACGRAMDRVVDALEKGDLASRIVGPVCKPVFRKWN